MRPSRGSAPGRWAPTRCDEIDEWLTSLLGDEDGVALIAVGGYGRCELAPHSDLDVMLLHDGRRDVAAVADRVWYPIWDRGIALDHSVRTLKEASRVVRSDVRAALGLLDARLVAGDARLAEKLVAEVTETWTKRARTFLPALHDATEARHARFGPVAFLLEPDLKEGHGGLRDVQVLRAALRATKVVLPLGEDVSAAYELLTRVRAVLHTHAGKALDRLGLEEQDAVARDAGFLDADELMGAVASAGRSIAWFSDDSWRRVRSALAGPRGRTGRGDRPISAGVVERDGEIVIPATVDIRDQPAIVLRVAAASAKHAVPIGRATLARLAAEAPAPPDPWPAEMRAALVDVLATGRASIDALEAIDQFGLLVRLLPEWAAVRNKPQRNAYHRFTVDRHLCEAAANAAALRDRVERVDLLLVGTWLHDIGKGFKGDHTDAGVAVVDVIGRRMGFDDEDVAALVTMVRLHLLLPDVATRRDLDDPATANGVADAVGDEATLQRLAALTEADSLATGPSAWSDWKATLVAELVARTGKVLAGRPLPAPAVPTQHHRALMRAGRVHVEVTGDEVTVVAPDRPGLLARVAGSLATLGLDVGAASIASENGMAVEVLKVPNAVDGHVDEARVVADVAAAVEDRLQVSDLLRDRRRAYAAGARRHAANTPPSTIDFDDGASTAATVIEVRTANRIGLLHDVAAALASEQLDIRSARVATVGDDVIDAFYATELDGTKISISAERRDGITATVLAAVDGV